MKILLYSTLYPNAEQKTHGVFVENRICELQKSHDVQVRVCAPVPWFPCSSPRFGRYAVYSRVPPEENLRGLSVVHPRYPVIPKLGMNAMPTLLAIATRPSVKRIIHQGFDFDVLDAHFCYPDGVAAVWLAKQLGKLVTLTARGNDISLYPKWKLPKAQLRWAIKKADAVNTVCQALADEIERLGFAPKQLNVLRNGVDLERFHVARDREAIRQELGFTGNVLLSVGHLIERKGNHLIVEAMTDLPNYTLAVVGDGEEAPALRKQARDLGVLNRVSFLGRRNPREIPKLMSAADALILASSREGLANVLLEAMACGTPVVATPVWGTPEVVTEHSGSILMEDRSSNAIVDAVRQLFSNHPDRSTIRRYAEQFSWEATSEAQYQLFSHLISCR